MDERHIWSILFLSMQQRWNSCCILDTVLGLGAIKDKVLPYLPAHLLCVCGSFLLCQQEWAGLCGGQSSSTALRRASVETVWTALHCLCDSWHPGALSAVGLGLLPSGSRRNVELPSHSVGLCLPTLLFNIVEPHGPLCAFLIHPKKVWRPH